MAVKRKYRLNLRNYGNLPAIMLSQYDEGYALEFEIRDGVDAASDLSAYTVTLKGTRADTLAYSFNGTISTNVLTFVIDTTMTACAGRGTAEIAIKDTANDVLFATFNMPVFVERAAVPEGSIDADVERAQEIAEQVQEIVDNAAAAVSGEAEKWATGQIDGTDVPSTDPAYENNAKYYAEQAADAAASIGIDATLTQAGKAADAKKTGDEITALKEDFNYVSSMIEDGEYTIPSTDIEQGTTSHGAPSDSALRIRTKLYKVSTGDTIRFTAGGSILDFAAEYYHADGTWYYERAWVTSVPTISENGFIRLVFRKSSTSSATITPSDYDATIIISTAKNIEALTTDVSAVKNNVSNLSTDVSELKTRFNTEIGKNLYNVNDPNNYFGESKDDCYSLTATGQIQNSTGMDAIYSVSHYIPVESGKTVYFSANKHGQSTVYQLVCYDANKQMIGARVTWVSNYTIPEGVEFIRVTSSQLANYFQCEYDGVTDYEEYSEIVLLNAKVSSNDIIYEQPVDADYLVIPSKIYGVQNKEYDIFLKNIIVGNYNRFIVSHTGAGDWFSRRIRYNIASVGNKSTTIALYNENYELVQSKNITYVNANSNAHSGENLRVLVVGDSFINSGYVTGGLINDFADDVANLQLLGTLGTAPNLHEGRSGWSSYEYTHEPAVGSVVNPFLNNGVFDFSNYMSVGGIDVPDYVIINLGINDGWKPMHGTTTAENLQTMIDSIHAYNSSIKVVVGTTPSTYLGDDVENGYLMHLMDLRKRQMLTKNVMDNIVESATVIICPTHVNFDTDYNFNMSTTTKNGQNSGTVPICSDETHPSASGFYQIADSYYACIKAN